jgi:transglycosylase-like protein
LLTRHTYSIAVLLAVLSIPAVALAAGGEDASPPQVGVAEAVPVGSVGLIEPVASLRHEMRAAARRFRIARRARLRRERRSEFAALPAGVSMATLEAIASCESGGDPTIVSADGSYRGKYQFSYETWAAVGGSGDPAAASEAEQDYRAALLYASSGSSPWPICG